MVSLRISSLKGWLWRRDSVKQEKEEGTESYGKGKKSISGREMSGKGGRASEGTSKELRRAASAASSSSSSESPVPEASDWSIGWYEPHGPGFCSDDSFAVLVPCYDSPPPSQTSPQTPSSMSKSKLWADVLSKVAMETETQAESTRSPPQ